MKVYSKRDRELLRGRASAGRHPQDLRMKKGGAAMARGGRGEIRTGAWGRKVWGAGMCVGERGGAGSPPSASPGSSGGGGGAAEGGKIMPRASPAEK